MELKVLRHSILGRIDKQWRLFRSNRLSEKGEHAAALVMSRGESIPVLYRAGMYLSLLNKSKESSLHQGVAHAVVGGSEIAMDIARRFIRDPKVRNLLGILAVQYPEQVLSLASGTRYSDIICYCKSVVHGSIGNIDELSSLSTDLALSVALRCGLIDQAKIAFDDIFESAGLMAPKQALSDGRLNPFHEKQCNSHIFVDDGPLITVIFTAYNEQEYLLHAVRSVLAQTWRNLEVIIVDDCSTDQTYTIAGQLEEEDKRVRLLRLDENSGTWKAKNVAINVARGAFIVMHDADDWSHPRKIEFHAQTLIEHPDAKCTSSYIMRVSEKTGYLFSRNSTSFIRWNPSSLMFRREVVDELGFYLTELLGADCEYAARIETRWGVKSHIKIMKPLSIGLYRKGSLSDKYRSPKDAEIRVRHWETWRNYHADSVRNANYFYVSSTDV